MVITNPKILEYKFLEEMSGDSYYPPNLVEKGKQILLNLCDQIERDKPADLDALYKLTHAATDRFNELAEEFYENDSEIETVARDCIGMDFDFIAQTYGFGDADMDELIATRDW